MKLKITFISMIFLSFSSFADRGDLICQTWKNQGYGNTITTPAITGSIQDKPADLAICFQGKDYSQEIAKSTMFKGLPGNDMKVISSSNVEGFREMYVSIYNGNTGQSVITRVIINEINNIAAYPGGLVSRQQIKDSDPSGYFIFIPTYITDAVYFNFIEPTGVALYRFHHIPGYPNSAADLEKVSVGYGEWVKKNGDIIISKDKLVKGEGRQVYGAVITPSGKEKCVLDATEKAWVLLALSQCE